MKKSILWAYHKFIVCAVIGLLLSFNLAAQQTNVSGKVTDKSGDPIPGVSIVLKGTTIGTISGIDGDFNLSSEIPSDGTLIFSFIGMQTREVKIQGQSLINVTLTDDLFGLEEVIVVGYGSVSKKDVTTAVSSVSTEDLTQRPINLVGEAIQGKAAGVSVVTPSGSPGAQPVIRIRGTTSLNGNNDPLYVVDGVPMTDISFLSSNDVMSMHILKDASSAAIYGSRAANGVIMITTKGGEKGQARITMNANFGVSSLANKIDVLNADQYTELLKDLGMANQLPAGGITDQTDWYDETYQTALSQNYQVAISNANERTSYYISGGYSKEEGIIKVAYFERYNMKARIQDQVKDWLKVGANISYSDYGNNGIIEGTGSNRAGVVTSVINTPTYAPIWNPDKPGQYYNGFYGGLNLSHPVENMSRSESNSSKSNRLLATGDATIDILPQLSFKSSLTLDRDAHHGTNFLDPLKTSYGRSQHGEASDERSQNSVITFDNILNFDKDFGIHKFSAMAGTSGTTSKWDKNRIGASHFIDGKIQTISVANKIKPGSWDTYSIASNWSIMSYFGRMSYNFSDKYLVTANMRADGSSKLSPDNRWGYFPSVSAAWRLSSESFLENTTWLSDLKLRMGWGQTGNQSGLGDYGYLELYSVSRQNWWETGKADALVTYDQSNLRNTDLTWETTTQTNIGIDLTALNNRLVFNMDWYYKKTTDMLMNVRLPAGSAATNSIKRNEGEMTNTGIELMISSRNLEGAFNWNTDFNISHNKNELTALELTKVYYDATTSDKLSGYAVRNEPGRPLGGFYGYISDGVDPETGELMYRDMNGNGLDPTDRTYIGDPNPDFTFGLNNTVNYKGLSLSILLQGSYGNDILNVTKVDLEGMYGGYNQSTAVLNRWRLPGQITDMPKVNFDKKISSYYIEDGSYLRVKNISLSYDVKGSFLKKMGVAKLRPYATASNLLTLTKYSGFDPEVNQWGNSGGVQGIDYGTFPQTRTFMFGVDIEL